MVVGGLFWYHGVTHHPNKSKEFPMSTVYSYLRFSDKKQIQGDSVRRQTKMRDDWLRNHPEHTLDDTLSLKDMGVSAFRGLNLDKDKADLGMFIHLANTGKIETGSILLLERLDRFSRLPVRKVYGIFCELVDCGLTIVTLDPPQEINQSNIDDMATVISVIIFMQLAFEQSREKRKRLSHVWETKRKAARANGTPMYGRRPAWLDYDKEKNEFVLNKEAAKSIRYIFTQTVKGVGQRALTMALNKQFKPLGKSGKWNSSYIQKVLGDKSVLGEYQPQRFTNDGERVQDGKPIANYYPRVIPDDLYYKAQAAKATRAKTKSQSRPFVNLFTGLLFGVDGHPRHVMTTRGEVRQKDGVRYIQRRLISWGHQRGLPNSCPLSFDYFQLEEMVLSILWELKDDLPPAKDIVATKENELLQIEERIEALGDELLRLSKPIPQVVQAIRDMEERKERVRQEIGQVQTFGVPHVKEAKSLLQLLENAKDKDKHNIRLHLWRVICGIVQKITIQCVKLPKRHVGAMVTIKLHNGQQRIVCRANDVMAETTPDGFVLVSSRNEKHGLLEKLSVNNHPEFFAAFESVVKDVIVRYSAKQL